MKNYDKNIEEGLKIEPDFKLGIDFKDQVVKMIRKKERIAQRKFLALIFIGVIIMFGVGIGFVIYLAGVEAFAILDQIVPLAVIVGGLVAVIQYLDKKLIKDKMFKQLA
jgi:hypothetical protein